MKRLLVFALAAAGAFAAAAETPQATSTAGKPAVKEESDVVRAARESSRKRKSTPRSKVITNETIKQRSGKAHITTTKNQPPVAQIPTTVKPAGKPKVLVVPQPKKEPAEPPKETLARSVDEAEDPLGEMDPAQAEHLAEEAAKRAAAAEKKGEAEKKPPHR